jgi:DNA modification methylase
MASSLVGTACLIATADCRRIPLPDAVAQVAVTSPPYFRLRRYSVPNEIGMEETPEQYIANLVRAFREVRRVLRDDGMLYVNIGDSYCNTDKWGGGGRNTGKQTVADDGSVPAWIVRERKPKFPGIKPKDIIGIPWMLAFAMRADGWYWRDNVTWAKVNPMPSSVKDRTTSASEPVLMFTKKPTYYYDWFSVLEKGKSKPQHRSTSGGRKGLPRGMPPDSGIRQADGCEYRNLRSVWSLSSESFKGSHYAVMPSKLAIPCIKAGSSERGCCPHCRAPHVREVAKVRVATRPGINTKCLAHSDGCQDSAAANGWNHPNVIGNRDPQRHVTTYRHVAWHPSCKCPPHEPIPCIVLDNFGGAGTTAMVASNLGRHGISLDAGRSYCEMAYERINNPHAAVRKADRKDKPMPLFTLIVEAQ